MEIENIQNIQDKQLEYIKSLLSTIKQTEKQYKEAKSNGTKRDVTKFRKILKSLKNDKKIYKNDFILKRKKLNNDIKNLIQKTKNLKTFKKNIKKGKMKNVVNDNIKNNLIVKKQYNEENKKLKKYIALLKEEKKLYKYVNLFLTGYFFNEQHDEKARTNVTLYHYKVKKNVSIGDIYDFFLNLIGDLIDEDDFLKLVHKDYKNELIDEICIILQFSNIERVEVEILKEISDEDVEQKNYGEKFDRLQILKN